MFASRWRFPGMATYGAAGHRQDRARQPHRSNGPTDPKAIWEPGAYLRTVPKLFEHLRVTLGEEVELLHDVHERISPSQAVSLCKELEKYHLFFLEDPLPPEEKDHFRLIRQQSSIPLAMGELFNTQQEYVPLIAERLIDFIRIHISQIGGLSMARKVAALCEFFGVKTAWHGPGDCSPVGPRRRAGTRAGQPQLRNPRRQRLPARDPRGLPRLPRDQGRLHVRQRGPRPGHRHRRKARRQVPRPRHPDLRLPLGHDPPARRHRDPPLKRHAVGCV